MYHNEMIIAFLAGHVFAIVGASADRGKYGNRVLRAYLESGRQGFSRESPRESHRGAAAIPTWRLLPEPVHGVSIVTPPHVTREILEQAAAARSATSGCSPGPSRTDWRQ